MLAAGAWFEGTPGRVADGRFHRAPGAGDLIDADACRRFDAALDALGALPGEAPRAVAHDLHPDFHSTLAACALAERLQVPAIPVQHHHAHLAAVLAEHGHAGPVVGIAADGVGLGTDGHAWGGELLHVDGAACTRLGHLRALPLPGGDRAAREPWRMAAAVLQRAGRGTEIARRFPRHTAAAQLASIVDRPQLSPPTTSLGRHFDAAAALLGLCEVNETGAQAAVALESAARAHGPVPPEPDAWRIEPDGTLDLLPLLARLADEPNAPLGAARFHATLAAALAGWLIAAAENLACRTVALGGGCFHNCLLSAALADRLAAAGLAVLRPERLPPGDAGLAAGQAWVAQRILQGN
ncbi:Kae1-like domain-containing protein [Pseudothauera rhizosphaerae]|uniref:Kae1-like domain-containing protein n=1 Tax=Pseudothauera rhizosphaerae TaxID=2565932 RepID=UPI001E5591AB|nr:carbamoyltransferase HypF [Pseudothauera rhizosphaerae]